MRYDANQEPLEYVTFMEKPALFTDLRVESATLPQGVERYELRHCDDNWGDPCELARSIVVNHYGTLLTTEPIQLPPDGRIYFDTDVLNFLGESMKLSNFMQKHPPVEKLVFEVTIPPIEEKALFYSDSKKDEQTGCIGHARGDFGKSGKEFWTTWNPHQEKLNQAPFRTELNQVVNWLRQEGGPLHDLQTMKTFGNRLGGNAVLEASESYGFKVETPKYEYRLRCTPLPGQYHLYCYCYDKAARERSLTLSPQKPSILEQLKPKPREQSEHTKKPLIRKAEQER